MVAAVVVDDTVGVVRVGAVVAIAVVAIAVVDDTVSVVVVGCGAVVALLLCLLLLLMC